MSRFMDVKTIQGELLKLTKIVGDWHASKQISALDRDLVLEKLRVLYDVVRFAEPVAAGGTPEPESVDKVGAQPGTPSPIDLGDVLSLDESAEESPIYEEEPELFVEAAPEVPKEDEAVGVPEEVVEPEMREAVEAVGESDSSTESEVSEAVESSGAPETVEAPLASEPSVEVPDSTPEPQVVAPTLFELDDQSLQHHRKQRIIMSLYDTAPTPAPKPREDEDVFEVISVVTTAAEPETEPATESVATPVAASESEVKPETNLSAKSDDVEQDESFDSVAAEDAPATDSDEPAPEDTELEEITLVPADKYIEPQTTPANAVLGEVMNQGYQTLADTLATPRETTAEGPCREPIGDLRRAIGINDKFLLIRDLFGGDVAEYDATIAAFNAFDNLDDCMIYIAENYAWNPNSDGAKLLMELLERKFL